jgi:AmmeMemoRadiSam system protein A
MEKEDKIKLLELARESIRTAFENQDPNINGVAHLNKNQGVFVTIHKQKELRGCIGYPEPIMPLYKAVIEAARNAAFNDPRFPRMTKDELREIEIEISVLSVPEIIKVEYPEEYPKKIEIGKDGLIIRTAEASGLLLPQVATEQDWTAAQFLNAVCQKAGLPFRTWQEEDQENNCRIFKFQAEIFNEKELLKQDFLNP